MKRHLAGSRRNKHLPIARTPRFSDSTVVCGLRHPGVRRPCRADVTGLALDPAQDSKPDHAARVVDITAIWPPITGGGRDSYRKAAEAGARGVSAAPMSTGMRINAYWGQVEALTGRQRRQIARMENRALATT
jgi:hypothetical protein